MPTAPLTTIAAISRKLERGETTARALVEASLEKIADPAGEGARAFMSVDAEGARAAGDAHDLLRKAGAAPSPLAGIPFAIKDLADIKGQVTRAGSKALADRPPAEADAPVVARLRAAGLILVGRTNMTEFAYSGIGANPHYGTPASPWDRATKRIPGGSSSGTGVAVADAMVFGGLGTDTGGSCRIPAAYCGITGWKPTARRVPLDGVVPLSVNLDSIGPLAPSVDCCAMLDAVMAAAPIAPADTLGLAGLRFFVPETIVLDGLDEHVGRDFEATLARVSAAGAHVTRGRFEPFTLIPATLAKGGLAASDSYAWHKDLLETKGDLYDPRVRSRIAGGASQSAADYIAVLEARRAAIASYERVMAGYDAILSPTTPAVPPRQADLARDEDYTRLNLMALRNTLMINVLDGCSIALPMSDIGAPPTSLMISGPAMTDGRILAIAKAIEGAIQSHRT